MVVGVGGWAIGAMATTSVTVRFASRYGKAVSGRELVRSPGACCPLLTEGCRVAIGANARSAEAEIEPSAGSEHRRSAALVLGRLSRASS
jgi:hypothetical protein